MTCLVCHLTLLQFSVADTVIDLISILLPSSFFRESQRHTAIVLRLMVLVSDKLPQTLSS